MTSHFLSIKSGCCRGRNRCNKCRIFFFSLFLSHFVPARLDIFHNTVCHSRAVHTIEIVLLKLQSTFKKKKIGLQRKCIDQNRNWTSARKVSLCLCLLNSHWFWFFFFSSIFLFAGRPQPQVRWLVNGVLVDDQYEHNTGDVIENRLLWPAVQRSDLNAIFTCQAVNTILVEPKENSYVLDLHRKYLNIFFFFNHDLHHFQIFFIFIDDIFGAVEQVG